MNRLRKDIKCHKFLLKEKYITGDKIFIKNKGGILNRELHHVLSSQLFFYSHHLKGVNMVIRINGLMNQFTPILVKANTAIWS